MNEITPINLSNLSPLDKVKKQICDNAELPLEQARATPPEAYSNQDYYQWEKDNILKKQWLSLAHISQLTEVGDYINVDMLGEPLSVIRGDDNQIRVLSRVCPHRGMDIMPQEYGHADTGNCNKLRCPYHHWVFELNGKLKGAPLMKEHPEVADKSLGLHEVRSAIWNGFVFVNLEGSAEAIETQFAGLNSFLDRWNLDELTMVADITWDCDFNWKVLVDNFMEPYHHAGAHHTIFQPNLPAQNCWTEPMGDNYLICHLPLSKGLQEKVKMGEPQLVDFKIIDGLKPEDYLEWTVYLGAPTFLLFMAVDRVYWYRLEPQSADKMILRTTMLIHPESELTDNYEETLTEQVELMRKFHMEDMEVCSAVQKGVTSSFYKSGPLSKLEEPIWQLQRYLARNIKATQA